MKNILKVFALVLALMMIIPCFAACNGGGNEKDTTTAGKNTGGDGTTTQGGDDPQGPSYRDLNSYVYRAYVRSKTAGTENAGFPCIDFWTADTQSSDPLTFAVYERNAAIEEDYNCKILAVDSTADNYEELLAAYLGGQKYELAIVAGKAAGTLATVNLLADLMDQDNLHLEEEYYDQNSISQLSLGGKLYYMSGDMCTSTLDNAVSTLFSPKLLEKYEDLQNPYELVKQNKWTLETMISMAKVVNLKTSSADKISAIDGDQVGYVAYGSAPLYYFYACGERISTNDADGYPAISIRTQGGTSTTVVDKLYELINEGQNPEFLFNVNGSTRNSNFKTEKVLFTDMILWDVRTQIRPTENLSYGILPPAKFAEGDDTTYSSLVWFQNTTHLWALPSFTADNDKASFLFEVFASRSHEEDSTMYAYFTKTMSLGAAQNSDARDMLGIIRNSLTYDIALVYDWGSFTSFLNNLDVATSNTFSSTTSPANIAAAEDAMNLTLDAFKNPSTPTT